MSRSERGNRLDVQVPDRFEELGRHLPCPAQDIAAKRAVSCARFDDVPSSGRAHRLPHFAQLPPDHRAEDRADFWARQVVPRSAHRLASRAVVAEARLVKRYRRELTKRNRPFIANPGDYALLEGLVLGR